MGFGDLQWKTRFLSMGDEAEAVFLEESPLGAAERLGWNRPRVSMKQMSPMIRHIPDYYSGGYLCECMGLGRDGKLKLKLVKYESLKWWNKSGNPVVLFAWNSHLGLYALIPWKSLVRLVAKARSAGIAAFSSDGNEYYPIEWEWIVEEGVDIVTPISWKPDA